MKRQTVAVLAVILMFAFFAALALAGGPDSCQYCGMDLKKFPHTRMDIKYDDGTEVHTCSIHCAAIGLALNIDKAPVAIMVGDYDTKSFIDAEQAHWAIGGEKQGVMTGRAKWAFKDRAAAESFVKENGGEVKGFDEALETAYEDMYKDTKMIREKRKKMKEMKMKGGM